MGQWESPKGRKRHHFSTPQCYRQIQQLVSYSSESKAEWTHPTYYPRQCTGVQKQNDNFDLYVYLISSFFPILYMFYNTYKCWSNSACMQFISNCVSNEGYSKILYWVEYPTKTLSKSLPSTNKASTFMPRNSLQKLSLPREAPVSTDGSTIYPKTQTSYPRVIFKCSSS